MPRTSLNQGVHALHAYVERGHDIGLGDEQPQAFGEKTRAAVLLGLVHGN